MSPILALQSQGILFLVASRDMAQYGHSWLILSFSLFKRWSTHPDVSPQPNILRQELFIRDSFLLYIVSKKKKKKTKLGRAVSAWQKDYGIMSCSCLARHPSGLIPFPFGPPASRPVKLLSFSFLRFSVFFGKIFFIGMCTVAIIS